MPAPGERSRTSSRSRSRGTIRALAVTAVAALAVSGCNQQGGGQRTGTLKHGGAQPSFGTPASTKPPAPTSAASIRASVTPQSTNVPVDAQVSVSVAKGRFDSVVFDTRNHHAQVPGSFNKDKTRWTASSLLEPGTGYVLTSKATDAKGIVATKRTPFNTQDLRLDQQTYPSIAPLQGETVGIGMPVIVEFDVAVTNRAAIERHLHVTSNPATPGSWHWVNSHEAHWRPVHFWKPGTRVHVDADINSIDAGHGVYGQLDNQASFTIGRSVVMRPDMRTDKMRVYLNGALARTIPITGGKKGFETRSGTKLIVEKFNKLRMNAATVGIKKGSPNYYNIPDVRYAERVTNSGEFLHAAPWSKYAQGHFNVSHGCVGMSTVNAAWLFHRTHRGDPVIVTGSKRHLESGNGWTDWNESFAQYRKGSALH